MKKIIVITLIILNCVSCTKKIVKGPFSVNIEKNENEEFNYIYVDGIRLKMAGNYAEALRNFERCVKIKPENDAVYFQLAQIMIQGGDIEKGKNFLLTAFKINPDNIWYHLMLFQIYQQLNIKDSALIYIEKASKLNPENVELKIHLAECYSSNNNYRMANEIYSDLEEKYGLNEKNGLVIVKSYLECNDFERAEKALEKLTQMFPEENLYKSMLCEVCRNLGNNEKAYEIYESFIEKGIEDPQIFVWISDFMINEKEFDQLFKLLGKIIINKQIKDDDKILCTKKLIENENLIKQKPEEIEKEIIKIEENIPGNQLVLILRPEFYEKSGRIEKGIIRLKEIIKEDRRNYYAWEKLLLMLEEKKDYDQLYKYAGECATEFNMSYLAKVMYANAASEKNEYKLALEEIRKAKIIAGKQQDALIQAMIIEADIYYKMGEFEKSFEIFEKALKIEPENIIVLNNYAYYLAEAGTNLEKAEKMSLKTVTKESNNTVYLDTYAWILYKKGKNKRALTIMKKIIEELNGKDPEYFEHYGFILKKAKKCNDAVKYWEKAFKADNRKEYLLKEIENCTKGK